MKIYYDVGMNNDNGFFTVRFSNNGQQYFYVEFDNLPDILGFQEKLGMGVEIYKKYLEEKISSLDTDQEIGNRE